MPWYSRPLQILKKKAFPVPMLAAICGLCLLGQPTRQLLSFEEVFTALKSGETVKAVFHYKDCKLIIDGEEIEEIPDAIGGMKIETWEYFAPGSIGNETGYIATSHKVLIQHPRHGFVYNYVKVNIYQDSSVEIVAKYLTPSVLEVKMDETFQTRINDETGGAAYFYTEKRPASSRSHQPGIQRGI